MKKGSKNNSKKFDFTKVINVGGTVVIALIMSIFGGGLLANKGNVGQTFKETMGIIKNIQNAPVTAPFPTLEQSEEVQQTEQTTTDTPYPTKYNQQTTTKEIEYVKRADGRFDIYNAPYEPMTTAGELNEAMNTYRQAHGLNGLSQTSALCQIAQERAVEITSNFSHAQGQQHSYNRDWDWAGYGNYGENLWSGSYSGIHIVEYGWDKSDGHRNNQLDNWSAGCAGVNGKFAVYMFAK